MGPVNIFAQLFNWKLSVSIKLIGLYFSSANEIRVLSSAIFSAYSFSLCQVGTASQGHLRGSPQFQANHLLAVNKSLSN
jgi:hypothetical protein